MKANEKSLVQTGALSAPATFPEIAEALDLVLGPSRRRRARPARLTSGSFRLVGNLVTPDV
ncbi:MAG TPA: hypothetical protein VIC85_19510 [Ktedonobacterales bacterium]